MNDEQDANIRKNCFACKRTKSGRYICDCLNDLYCAKGEYECNFYKPKSVAQAENKRDLRRKIWDSEILSQREKEEVIKALDRREGSIWND